MNRLNKTESAVSSFCRFSLFLKDPFFLDYFESVSKKYSFVFCIAYCYGSTDCSFFFYCLNYVNMSKFPLFSSASSPECHLSSLLPKLSFCPRRQCNIFKDSMCMLCLLV